MMKLDFDFKTGSRRPNAAALVLLVLGGVALAASLLQLRQTDREEAVLQDEIARLELARDSRPGGKTGKHDEAKLAQSRIAASLDYSWQPAFAALEAAHSGKIALVSLEAGQGKKQMSIVAEARRLADAVEYVTQLGHQNGVKRAVLLQHEVREDDAEKPVRFSVQLEMRA